MRQQTEAPFPANLLTTPWDFEGQRSFTSQNEFEAAVTQHVLEVHEYAPEITLDDWQPQEVILYSPSVLIEYYSDSNIEEAGYKIVKLESNNRKWFSAGELLFKLHNATIEQLRESGHHWFEGLTLERVTAGGVPVYLMIPGS